MKFEKKGLEGNVNSDWSYFQTISDLSLAIHAKIEGWKHKLAAIEA
jgi:hypothetical protein